jgi:ribosomal protein L11 methylase PrmA
MSYDMLMESGLYDSLVKDKLLIPHEEVGINGENPVKQYKVIKPVAISFISYPYEWSFSQLKDAALLTLKIQKRAIKLGMSLKDATAYNIQFHNGKPIFIDTLSFEKLPEGTPWVAYKQFCQHFLGPLALMSFIDLRLSQLLRIYIDGIPLDLIVKLLPGRTKFIFGLFTHIHLHSLSQKKYEDKPLELCKMRKISRFELLALLDSLETIIKKLKPKETKTEWGGYYDNTNYSDDAFQFKKSIIASFIEKVSPKTVWDLGANEGVFSRIAEKKGIHIVAFDIDPIAVERNYVRMKKQSEACLLPLILDLINPSPAIGWNNNERFSLCERGPVDMILALALVHHLAISNNLPLSKIVQFLKDNGQYLVIEFVPKSDSQVKRLLQSREDIFPEYNLDDFTKEFIAYFDIIESHQIRNSDRILFLMKRK